MKPSIQLHHFITAPGTSVFHFSMCFLITLIFFPPDLLQMGYFVILCAF